MIRLACRVHKTTRELCYIEGAGTCSTTWFTLFSPIVLLFYYRPGLEDQECRNHAFLDLRQQG